MSNSDTVVAAPAKLTKLQLHAKLMRGWSRAIDNHGRGKFLDALGISSQALAKQNDGSMPGFDLIDAAIDLEPTVLDDWLRAKGMKLVHRDAVCDTDDVSVLLSRVLNHLIEAQHPDSPGGRRIIPTEIFKMENMLRELTGKFATLLDQAATYRGDTMTPMRSASR